MPAYLCSNKSIHHFWKLGSLSAFLQLLSDDCSMHVGVNSQLCANMLTVVMWKCWKAYLHTHKEIQLVIDNDADLCALSVTAWHLSNLFILQFNIKLLTLRPLSEPPSLSVVSLYHTAVSLSGFVVDESVSFIIWEVNTKKWSEFIFSHRVVHLRWGSAVNNLPRSIFFREEAWSQKYTTASSTCFNLSELL